MGMGGMPSIPKGCCWLAGMWSTLLRILRMVHRKHLRCDNDGDVREAMMCFLLVAALVFCRKYDRCFIGFLLRFNSLADIWRINLAPGVGWVFGDCGVCGAESSNGVCIDVWIWRWIVFWNFVIANNGFG